MKGLGRMETKYITITLPKKKEKKRSEFNRNNVAILLVLAVTCVGIFYASFQSQSSSFKANNVDRNCEEIQREIPVSELVVSPLTYYSPISEEECVDETLISTTPLHVEKDEPVRETIQNRDSYALKYFEFHDMGYPAGFDNCLGEFKLTFYCACEKCCGKTTNDPAYGITRSGTYVSEGRTVAVDPNLIPLGTQIYIKGLGVFTAEDTGSAIDSQRIDIYLDSHQEAIYCGVETAEVYIEN